MPLSRRDLLLSVPASALLLAVPSAARARVAIEYTYPWAQVWQSAVRLVRVDLECPITDRDESVGFVMFEYHERERGHTGSLELVRVATRDGSERIRVAVRVPSMPSWVERMIVDRLSRKLREDYGDPPAARGRAPVAAAPEAPPSEDAPDAEGGERAEP